MKGLMVTIGGDWSRSDTDAVDVRMMRKKLAPYGTFHVRKAQSRGDDLGGDFVVTVFVPLYARASWDYHLPERTRLSRAKVALRHLLQDATCRPPEVSQVHLIQATRAQFVAA